MEIKNYIKG